jgi:hypothetical protein
MKTPVYESRHARRLTRVLAAILLAATGTAVVMAWMPSSIEAADVDLVLDKLQAPLVKAGVRQVQNSDASTAGNAPVRVKCAECGVDPSIGESGHLGGGVHPGAVVGLASGALISEPERGDVRSHAFRMGERSGGN